MRRKNRAHPHASCPPPAGVVVVTDDPPTGRGQLAAPLQTEVTYPLKIQLRNRPPKRVIPRVIFGGVFSELRDARRAQGKRYALEPLLCAIVMSLMAGANSLRTIEVFIGERRAQLNELFGTDWRKAPSWVGIRKFLLQLDEHDLESAVRAFAQKQVCAPPGRQFIALDGKALRGSASRLEDMTARHIVSAFDQQGLIVLGHVEVAEKSNEIPAAQALIESLGLQGRVFTMDALHCQKKR